MLYGKSSFKPSKTFWEFRAEMYPKKDLYLHYKNFSNSKSPLKLLAYLMRPNLHILISEILEGQSQQRRIHIKWTLIVLTSV